MLFCVHNINRYSEAFWNCYTPTDECHEDMVTVKPFLFVIYIFMRAQKVTSREPLYERTCLDLCVNILNDVQIKSLDLQSLLQVPNEMNDMWEHRKNIPGTLLQYNEILTGDTRWCLLSRCNALRYCFARNNACVWAQIDAQIGC